MRQGRKGRRTDLLEGEDVDRRSNIDRRNLKGYTELAIAAYDGSSRIVSLLIDRGANVNIPSNDGWTPLMWAALVASSSYKRHAGHHEVVKILLKCKDLNINAQNRYGWTALYVAAMKGESHEIVELLLAAGADATITDRQGRSPLDRAKLKGRMRIVALLKVSLIICLRYIHGLARNDKH